jgi:hypothetical protein
MHRWSQSRSRLRVENGVKGRFGERPFFFCEEHDPEKPAADLLRRWEPVLARDHAAATRYPMSRRASARTPLMSSAGALGGGLTTGADFGGAIC